MIEGRIGTRKIWFNLDGPGVKEALNQMGRVHYVKKFSPEKGEYFEYHRSDDDLAATVENIVWVVDSKASATVPASVAVKRPTESWRPPELVRLR